MIERICRNGDENIYQPRIHSERIRELKTISLETGLPITVLVDYAIRSYVNAYQEEKRKKEALQDEVAWRMENGYDERFDEPNDESEDLSNYLDPYQNNP